MASTPNLDELRAWLRRRSGADGSASQLSHLRRAPMDRSAWPPAGLAPGEVAEWIATDEGSGAMDLALSSVRSECAADLRWLVVDPLGESYAPAWESMGYRLSQVVFVTARDPAQALWAVEQGLRSRGVDGVLGRLAKISPVAFRRLKLAAETGGTRCLLVRGAEALREASWADIRLLVSPLTSPTWQNRRFQVKTLKLKNGVPGGVVEVERDGEAGTVRVVSELADPADHRPAPGA